MIVPHFIVKWRQGETEERSAATLPCSWNCHAASNLRHYGAMDIAILPSLLAADLGRLANECRRAAGSGADALHWTSWMPILWT